MIDKRRLMEKLNTLEDDLYKAIAELPHGRERDIVGQLRRANDTVLKVSNSLTALLIDLEP